MAEVKYTVLYNYNVRLKQDGKLYQVKDDDTEILHPNQRKAFLQLCAGFHGFYHRWASVNGIAVEEESFPPGQFYCSEKYIGLGPGRLEVGEVEVFSPERGVVYDLGSWVLFIVEYPYGRIWITGAFLHGWDNWRKSHDVFQEFEKFLEKVRKRDYSVKQSE